MRTKVAPLRVLQASAASFQGSQEQASRQKAAWGAAAFGAAALASTGAMVTLCDVDPKFKPETYKNLKDPMTIYAQHAIRKETEEQAQVMQQTEEGEQNGKQEKSSTVEKDALTPRPTVQATSQAARKDSEKGTMAERETSKATQQTTAQATSPVDTSLAPVQPPQMTADEIRIEEKARKAKQHSGGLKIFSGNGNMSLALEIAKNLGINLGKATIGRFADGEVNVVIHENVRGKDVYVIQPTCSPVNDNLMELLLMVSTLRRASARRITVVIPYYGYARQDRKMQVRLMLEFSLFSSSVVALHIFLTLSLLYPIHLLQQ